MRFALLIYGEEGEWSSLPEAEMAKVYADHEAFGKWLAEKGWNLGGEELHGSERAKTVRKDAGSSVVSDGPFAETKEQLGGFYVIECSSIGEAVEAAERLPARAVEVRQIVEAEERPS